MKKIVSNTDDLIKNRHCPESQAHGRTPEGQGGEFQKMFPVM